MNKQYLITSGCSFTEVSPTYKTWPYWLTKKRPEWTHYNEATGGSGNDLISRRTIYRIQKLLQDGITPENITVLMMWSGIRRNELYIDRKLAHALLTPLNYKKELLFTTFMDDAVQEKEWLYNSAWDFKADDVSAADFVLQIEFGIIRSLEHILRVQWFLEKHNIKCCMMTYMDIFSAGMFDPIKKQPIPLIKTRLTKDRVPEAKFLWDMIDFDKFLFLKTKFSKYSGLLEYCLENEGGWQYPEMVKDCHPHESMHQLFVDQVLLPRIEKI